MLELLNLYLQHNYMTSYVLAFKCIISKKFKIQKLIGQSINKIILSYYTVAIALATHVATMYVYKDSISMLGIMVLAVY